MAAKRTSRALFLTIATFLLAGTTLVLFGDVKLDVRSTTGFQDTPDLSVSGKGIFSWSKLKPSEDLRWVDCDSGYQCARLQVPLNYSDPQGKTTAIALIRWPSSLPPDSPSYRGPVLFNPGGPGGSGVGMIRNAGQLFAEVLGPEFDIVGFDPRGVGRSTPAVSFFESWAERIQWYTPNIRVINATSDGIPRYFARAQLTNELAKERDANVLAHINTDHTARDMLRITEAHGREKLQYWGFSYGSVLGATFAAMFPDKVERLVIDGVMDAEDYYNLTWKDNLIDTERAMQSFYDTCFEAGPERCAFYADSPNAIAKNLTTIYDSLRARPVPVRSETSYGLLDYSTLRIIIFSSLYSPYKRFPILAQGLADLSAGNGLTLWNLTGATPFEFSCSPEEDERLFDIPDPQSAILCNDGAKIPNTLEDTLDYLDGLKKVSEWWDVWGPRTSCSGWPEIPKTHFRGPIRGNTSFPLLIVGNAADPVTPLWAAKKTSTYFPGSVVLSQNSAGHCSVAAPSTCTLQYIHDYFVKGTLPEEGTWCQVIGSPFPEVPNQGEYHESLDSKAKQTTLEVGVNGDNNAAPRVRFVEVAKKLSDVVHSGRVGPLGV